MENFFVPNKIPGMVELCEQLTLKNEAQSINLNDNGSIVEFGAFFGLSTLCLVNGLVNNPRYTPQSQRIYTYDCFDCAANGDFKNYVEDFAKRGGVQSLLEVNRGRVSFFKIFEHYLSSEISEELVEPIISFVDNSLPPKNLKKISLLHLDSPKHYEELRPIIKNFFPLLQRSSVILAQDFFYMWTATLIAAFGVMIESKKIAPRYSSASTLVFDVLDEFDQNYIERFDQNMDSVKKVLRNIDLAIQACAAVEIDRSSAFLSRAKLARAQYMITNGQTLEGARDILSGLTDRRKYLNRSAIKDIKQLIAYKFDATSSYREDYG